MMFPARAAAWCGIGADRPFLAGLHPRGAWICPVASDSAFEQDPGLDSLSRMELAARIEHAFGATLPEHRWAGR